MDINKPQITAEEVTEWETKFKESVSNQVQFEVRENGGPSMQLYNGDSGIEALWAGTIVLNADNYIKWTFSIQNNPFLDCKINLTEDNFRIIQKLNDFYNAWKEEWSKQLTMPANNADDSAMNTDGAPSTNPPASPSPGGMSAADAGMSGAAAAAPSPVNERKANVKKNRDKIIEEQRERMMRLAKLWK